MSIRYGRLLSLGFLVGFVGFVGPTASADENSTLVATVLQDEPRKIPEDNTAYFSRADRKVRFQLVKLSGVGNEMLASTNVKVIGPAGEQAMLTADANGIATLENAKPGLHALVVAGETGHVAVPIALREQADGVVGANAVSASTAKLTLMDIDPQEVVRVTSSYLSPEIGGVYEDIDSSFVSTADVSQGLQYRVRLGDEGTLDGQVYSVLRSGVSTAGVELTNVIIYRGNTLVARTTADQFGKFSVNQMAPGVYGLIGAGPAGYAAFAFEAYDAASVATASQDRETLVSAREEVELAAFDNNMARGTMLPVLLVPPSMVPAVVEQIQLAGFVQGAEFVEAPLAAPMTPFGQAPFSGAAGAGGGSGGGSGGGAAGGGIGGLLGIAAIGGIAAAAIASNDDDPSPIIASPAGI